MNWNITPAKLKHYDIGHYLLTYLLQELPMALEGGLSEWQGSQLCFTKQTQANKKYYNSN